MADAREVGRRFIDAFNAHDQQRIRDLNGDNTVFEAPGDVKKESDAGTEIRVDDRIVAPKPGKAGVESLRCARSLRVSRSLRAKTRVWPAASMVSVGSSRASKRRSRSIG